MAIDQSTHPRFAGRLAAPTAEYPQGKAINQTVTGATDGTPYIADDRNDVFGMQQAILRWTAQAPSGTPETALMSQFVAGMAEIAMGRATLLVDTSTGANQINLSHANGHGPQSYFDGLTFEFRAAIPSDQASLQINVNGLGNKPYSNDLSGDVAGGVGPNQLTRVRFNLAQDRFDRVVHERSIIGFDNNLTVNRGDGVTSIGNKLDLYNSLSSTPGTPDARLELTGPDGFNISGVTPQNVQFGGVPWIGSVFMFSLATAGVAINSPTVYAGSALRNGPFYFPSGGGDINTTGFGIASVGSWIALADVPARSGQFSVSFFQRVG